MRQRVTGLERWIAFVRLAAVPFAILQVSISSEYPPHYRLFAGALTIVLAIGAVVFWVLARTIPDAESSFVGVTALAFDCAIVTAFVLTYHFEQGTPTRQLLFLPVAEGAVRFAIPGALAVAALLTPVAAVFEWLRSDRFHDGYRFDYVTFQFGALALMGLIVGWLVGRIGEQTALSEARALEAEQLRDALGRRVDVLEAANRCARALASSLELEAAFGAFIREVTGLVPFDRMAVVLAEGDEIEVLATAGLSADTLFPPGTRRPIAGSLAEKTFRGETVYREDMQDRAHPEEDAFVELGLRSRLSAPLMIGAQSTGLISFVRRQPRSFTQEEVELVTLLGRVAGTAVQNIRAFEHELRSPMASVIGSARTLQARWRELSPEHRESFLALIADETSRLATLIGDVLDTSRIDAGTFTYTFDEVDMEVLVQESVATAALGQDEVRVRAGVSGPLPLVRGDPERLRQVLGNLIDNAVKYSNAGGDVDVRASSANGLVRVEVRDRGPGIPREQQRLIFEKFGRAKGRGAKPGTGLGLFIARSIAEAHGGTLEVRSTPGDGATFVLELPVDS
jgi:signal transduction histidine kinase